MTALWAPEAAPDATARDAPARPLPPPDRRRFAPASGREIAY